jgi:subtilase family serine protease
VRRLLALLGLLLAAAPAVPAAAADGAAVRVGAPAPLPAGATVTGEAPAEQELSLYVALQPQDPAALESFATAVSTPGSPSFRDHLSVPEFAQRFGAGAAAIASVRAALAARGLRVGPTAANRLSLPVTATVAEAEEAFGVSLQRVALPSGRVALRNDRAPTIPAAAAPYVEGVIGLDDVAVPHRHAVASPRALGPGPQPCTAAIGQLQKETGYTADQIAATYRFSDLYAAGDVGAGQTVALMEFEPYLPSDVATYQSCYGTAVPLTNVPVEGGAGPYKKGDDGESALDIEQITGLAPGVHVIVYEAPESGSEISVFSAFVQQDAAQVMSSSWGNCEPDRSKAELAAFGTLLQEAAAQGQSFFVAAGDDGASDCYEEEGFHDKRLAVDTPASQPFATGVGGTAILEPTAPPAEYLWNEGPEFLGGGGGGVSAHFPMPSYQLEAAPALGVVNGLSSGSTCGLSPYCREVPDVSANAEPDTGYVVFAEQKWQVIGGTSAAAPLWAALAALTNASPACGGHTIGFANPALYAIAGGAYAANFHDVVSGRPGGPQTNNLFEASGPFPAGAGYDMATGLGSPVAPALAASLCALATPVVQPPAPAPAAAPAPSRRARRARLVRASLRGLGRGEPRLRFTLQARPGARLRAVTITLPPGLDASRGEADVVRIRVAKPRHRAAFTLAFPALRASAKLVARARGGHAGTLGFVVSERESGGVGARFPIALPAG